MTYDEFLTKVIDEGIEAANKDYANSSHKRMGAVEGFNACRGKNPVEILAILQQAHKRTMDCYVITGRNDEGIKRYWGRSATNVRLSGSPTA